jgi:hypothetical protein
LKKITINISWNDDHIHPLFSHGQDTVVVSISDSNGKELYNNISIGEGIIQFEKYDINQQPSITDLSAKDIHDAENKIKQYYHTNWKNISLNLKISLLIGEKGIFQRFNDKGNDVTIAISYQYYEPTITLINSPPNTSIISKTLDVIYKNFIEIHWTGNDNETQTSELLYSYSLSTNEEKTQYDWSSWTSETKKLFHNLSNGEYLFLVKTKDPNGQIDPSPAEFSFIIEFNLVDDTQNHHEDQSSGFSVTNKNKTQEDNGIFLIFSFDRL